MHQGDVKRWRPCRGCFLLLRFCPRIEIRPMWTSRCSPAPGVSAHLQARPGQPGSSCSRGDMSCRRLPGRLGMAAGWAGALILDRVPDVTLPQPHGHRAAHGEAGWTQMLLLVPGEMTASHLTNVRTFRKQPAPRRGQWRIRAGQRHFSDSFYPNL